MAAAQRASALDAMREWLSADAYAEFRQALTRPFRRCLRQHPLRGQLTGWGELEAVPWAPHGWFYPDHIDPGTRLDYHTGLAYPQDAASQLPVVLLDPQPGELIIDCCAAPGSKTTQIGLALGDRGAVVAADASPKRRRVLAETLARQGVLSALVTPVTTERLAEMAAGTADGVLVDVPCSGHVERSIKQSQRMAQRQLAILMQAAQMVAPGGRLVYSTCTPYHFENEAVVRAFLSQRPDWRVGQHQLPGCDPDLDGLGACRLWPHRQGTEPFFACRLEAPQGGTRASLSGNLPPSASGLPGGVHQPESWHLWQRGRLLLAASPEAAALALPSEARGLIIAEGQHLTTWGAQALLAARSDLSHRAGAQSAPEREPEPAPEVQLQSAQSASCALDWVETWSHQVACSAWAGVVPADQAGQSAAGVGSDQAVELAEKAVGQSIARFASTTAGAPLGVLDNRGGLQVPSRLRRDGLC